MAKETDKQKLERLLRNKMRDHDKKSIKTAKKFKPKKGTKVASLKNLDGVLTNLSAKEIKKLTGMTPKELGNHKTSGLGNHMTIKDLTGR